MQKSAREFWGDCEAFARPSEARCRRTGQAREVADTRSRGDADLYHAGSDELRHSGRVFSANSDHLIEREVLTRGEEALRGAAGDAYRASSGDGLAVLRTGGRRRRGKGWAAI